MLFKELKHLVDCHAQELLADDSCASNKYRARHYERLAELLEPLEDLEADGLKIAQLNVSQHMKDSLRLLMDQRSERSLRTQLQEIDGIGKKLAQDLIDEGIKSVAEILKYKKFLPKRALVFIASQPQAITRKLAQQIIKTLTTAAEKLGLTLTATGSYRREREILGDLDIIVRGDATLEEFTEVIQSHFKITTRQRGSKSTMLNIAYCRHNIALDIFKATEEDFHAMLLYSTGSRATNIMMRKKARRKGMLLNRYGLFLKGKKISAQNEKDYFKALDMEYIIPKDR